MTDSLHWFVDVTFRGSFACFSLIILVWETKGLRRIGVSCSKMLVFKGGSSTSSKKRLVPTHSSNVPRIRKKIG
jgi:hypothetical protein